MKEPVDPQLVQRAVAGSREAFEMLITAHYDVIYRMAWRWVGSREEAEDVTQEVCVKVGRAIRGFRGDASFSTWLHRITYTTAVDHLRNHNAWQDDRSKVIPLFSEPNAKSPESQLLERELWEEVHDLPPQQRDAVLLVYGEDLNHAEAAALMGCSEKTVSWHLHAARKQLKKRLQAVG